MPERNVKQNPSTQTRGKKEVCVCVRGWCGGEEGGGLARYLPPNTHHLRRIEGGVGGDLVPKPAAQHRAATCGVSGGRVCVTQTIIWTVGSSGGHVSGMHRAIWTVRAAGFQASATATGAGAGWLA